MLIHKQIRDFKKIFLFQILVFLSLSFIVRGLPTEKSIRVTILISAQAYVGATMWRFLTKRHRNSLIELLAAGFALGSALFTVVDQSLIFIGLHTNDILMPSGMVFGAFVFNRIQKNIDEISEIFREDFQSLMVVTICVFMGFGEFSHGSLIAISVLSTAYILLISRQMSVLISAIVSQTSLCLALLTYFLIKPPIAYSSWFLRPLFTRTDDAVFSESVAYSLSMFGPSNYAAAAGTGLRYHWFSLAWSGLIQRSASISPFGMTLHVVPVVSFFIIAMLLIAIGKRLGLEQRHLFIAPLVLYFTSSVPDRLYFYGVINTSNVMPFIWSLTFLLVFILHTKEIVRFGNFLLGIFAGVTLLSKMPYAVALLGGIATSSIFVFLNDRAKRRSVLVQLSVIALVIIPLFLLFLRPHSWENRTYLLDWNLMNIAVGSQFRIPIALIFILILLFTRFPLLFVRNGNHKDTILKVFILGSVSTGIIRFVVNGNSAEEYFLNSALVFGAVGIAIAIQEITPRTVQLRTWKLFGLGTCSGLLTLVLVEVWNRSDFQDGRWWQSRLQILIPFFVAIATCTGATMLIRRSLGSDPFRMIGLLLIFCLVGANVGIHFSQIVKMPVYSPSGSVATEVDLSSLNWLRDNSGRSELVATNRFLCSGSNSCDFDESSFLISAVANRQVLIEGPRFVSGGRPYPNWIIDRIQISTDFANAPSEQALKKLLELGVTWFYLDTRFLTNISNIASNPWNSFATVEYRSSNILILRLIS